MRSSLSLLLALIPTLGQSQEEKHVLIEGQVGPIKASKLILVRSADAGGIFAPRFAIDSCSTDSLGYFRFLFKADEPDFYQVWKSSGFRLYTWGDMYLCPGDTLALIQEVDGTYQLNGNASLRHSYLINAYERFGAGNHAFGEQFHVSVNEFISYINERRERQIRYLNESLTQLKDSRFFDYCKALIEYTWQKGHYDYQQRHQFYKTGEWGYLPIDSLPRQFTTLPKPNQSEFSFTTEYHALIKGFVDIQFNEWFNDKRDSIYWKAEPSQRFSIINEQLSGVDRDIALYHFSMDFSHFLFVLQDSFWPLATNIENYFRETYTKKVYLDAFLEHLRSLSVIAEEQPAPQLTLPDTAGTLVSLSDFRGKVVYINFWGTWCTPCIASIPEHQQMREAFTGQDIVFLNVAMEAPSAMERWKEFLRNTDFDGIHVVASGQFRNDQLRPYLIRAAPTYVLIDREGRIARTRAYEPPDAAIQIRELLQRE